MALAGFVAPDERWAQFDVGWNAALARNGAPFLQIALTVLLAVPTYLDINWFAWANRAPQLPKEDVSQIRQLERQERQRRRRS